MSALEYVEAYASRAVGQCKDGNLDGAVASLSKALAYDPDYEPALVLRGVVWMHSQHPKRAIDDFSRAIRANGHCVGAYLKRAEVQQMLGHTVAAIQDYSRVLELDPQHLRALHARGLLYAERRRMDESLADLERLVELTPEDADARLDLGFVRFITGDLGGATRELRCVLPRLTSSSEAARGARALLKYLESQPSPEAGIQ